METTTEKKRILLAEDDEFISDVYTRKFTKEGFDVDLAMNGEQALQKAREHKPDIILLDLIMPVKDGFETLKELKADPGLKDIRVIVLSNLSQDEDRAEVRALGAVDYCVKAQVSFGEMVDKIKLHLAPV
ncbi:MAG: response regulator [Patescibacteria group bacterium]